MSSPQIHDWSSLSTGFRDGLLFGNGASMAVDSRFGYSSLWEHAQKTSAVGVQGILTAIELRDRYPDLLITEAHPKALRWLLREAQALAHDSEHQRDAHLAAITAWALFHSEPGWRDLYQGEPSFYSPIAQPLVYFTPVPAG